MPRQAAAAEALGHRLADQASDRATDCLRAFDRPAELYQNLSDQADAATAATRARYEQRQRDRVRDQGWER
ncbi:MAG: hypothetical protein ACRDTT_00485 [Pseudonocardiaceae bacterium]